MFVISGEECRKCHWSVEGVWTRDGKSTASR